ncbi:DNA cytosine methyltransferase [Campylobacter majalis]|uniref:DNA cytosine methyltransferase n=1 Tax=Campylobacter majalis TaxID=2790656 RepID=UPI003D68A28C
MNILDLFSGIGGFSLGFESANFKDYDFTKLPSEQKSKNDGFFKTLAFCECDKACQAVLKKHFKNTPIFDDVTKITAKELKELGRIDVITGGFPCQDLSLAGRRVGINGSRSGLFSEILRIASETKPKYIIFENTPELIRNKRYFSIFAEELGLCGYDYRAFLLRASDYGYMHERKRAFIIAYTDKIGRLNDDEIFGFVSDENTHKSHETIMDLCREYAKWQRRGYYNANHLPDIRNANGLSCGVERVGMLGNSVVPEIVARFARFIKRIER